MKKNKKNNRKMFGLVFILFIYFFTFFNTTIAYWEYQNPGGLQSNICSYGPTERDSCESAVKAACGANTTAVCVSSTTPCNSNGSFPVVCPPQAQPISPTTAPFRSTYNLLAPIGEMKTAPTNYGDYINSILRIIIGLCGALAVIMIVIGGVQYMGDESVFGKTEAKSNITRAIFGLLIALGAYALLNTINPDLLSTDMKIKGVSASISNEALVTESSGLPSAGQPLGTNCPSGYAPVIVNGVTIMNTCSTIAPQIATLITQAKAAGYNLTGSSFRSYADQMALRRKNCPDPVNSPASECTPPTAKAGTSMHESGLAIDFKCNGVVIQTTDNECFLWLKANASGAGLLNLGSEPWHWSTNGH